MPERIAPGPVSGLRDNCEAVCIHTKKIFDSCREKDIALYRFREIDIQLEISRHIFQLPRARGFSPASPACPAR
jgi:hypothetical protein